MAQGSIDPDRVELTCLHRTDFGIVDQAQADVIRLEQNLEIRFLWQVSMTHFRPA